MPLKNSKATGSIQSILVGSVIPPGTITPFAGTNVPDGWFLCNGAPVSRETYSALFSSIGTFHGNGDGSTTFNLPDYQGQFLRGKVNFQSIYYENEENYPTSPHINNSVLFVPNHGINRTGFKIIFDGEFYGYPSYTVAYVIIIDSDRIAIAATLNNALNGIRVDLTQPDPFGDFYAFTDIIQYEDPKATSRFRSAIGGVAGDNVGARQEDALQNITGSFDIDRAITSNVTGAFVGVNNGSICDGKGGTNFGNITFNAARVARADIETRPTNTLVNYIIKY